MDFLREKIQLYIASFYCKYVYVYRRTPSGSFLYSGVCTAIMMIGELSFRYGSRQRKTFILFILYFYIVIVTNLNH